MQGDAKNLLAAFDDDIEFRLSRGSEKMPSPVTS
jgi:ketosteroid isomerase-like protein